MSKILLLAIIFSSICLLDTIYVIGSGRESYLVEGNLIARYFFERKMFAEFCIFWGVVWYILIFLGMKLPKKLRENFFSGMLFASLIDITTHLAYWLGI